MSAGMPDTPRASLPIESGLGESLPNAVQPLAKISVLGPTTPRKGPVQVLVRVISMISVV